MKTVPFYTLKYSFFILSCIGIVPVIAQDKDSTALHISKQLQSKEFVFRAQTATPQTGGFIQLNYPYDLKVKQDSIISYLPYYGRAYVAPMTTEDAGLNFTSNDFTYENEKKEDKWEITIVTKGLRDNYKLFFTIFKEGEAELQVTSNNRQPIRFTGYILEKNAK